jgi:DNA primase
VVGWTGRKVTAGKPKYLTTAQPGYVFNLDRQRPTRQFVIVVEGQFDAIAIDGVAIMHNEPNTVQCARINALGREVIVVPDQDQAGAKLIKAALDNNWNISIPDWGAEIKDVADAVQHYGRLYTLTTILKYRESNSLKIEILKKQLEQQHNEK